MEPSFILVLSSHARGHPYISLTVPCGPEAPGAPPCPNVEATFIPAGGLWAALFSEAPTKPTHLRLSLAPSHPESSDAAARPFPSGHPSSLLGPPSVPGCTEHCCNSASSRGRGVCLRGAVRAEIITVGIVPKPRNVLPVPIERFCFASGFKEQSGRQCLHAKTLEFWIFGFLWE